MVDKYVRTPSSPKLSASQEQLILRHRPGRLSQIRIILGTEGVKLVIGQQWGTGPDDNEPGAKRAYSCALHCRSNYCYGKFRGEK